MVLKVTLEEGLAEGPSGKTSKFVSKLSGIP